MASIRTSISATRTSSSRRGFTLIEILVVVALIALITAALVPNIGISIRATIDSTNRELAATVRTAYDEAILKGRVTRMAFDLEKHQYWVEQGPANLTLMSVEQREEQARKESRLNEEERKNIKKPVFGIAKDVTRDKKNLPGGVIFNDVINGQSKEPVKTGIVYSHIFPHGFMEKLTVHLKDTSGHEATLIADPVSGKSRVFNGYVRDDEK